MCYDHLPATAAAADDEDETDDNQDHDVVPGWERGFRLGAVQASQVLKASYWNDNDDYNNNDDGVNVVISSWSSFPDNNSVYCHECRGPTWSEIN